MPLLKPFAAVRPTPDSAAALCAPPYDVLDTEEARAMASGNPLSFLRVGKPEIDLPPDTDPYSEAVYRRAAENFQALLSAGHLVQDDRECFYLYRLEWQGRAQTGIVAVASVQAYIEGRIKRHELTRPAKETDRIRHMEAIGAQTGPAFLAYRSHEALDALIRRHSSGTPLIDFTAPDDVRHALWVVSEPAAVAEFSAAIATVPALYICDGHHRSAASMQVSNAHPTLEAARHFLAVTFPHHELRILPYNRVVHDLNGLTTAEFLAALDGVSDALGASPTGEPANRGEFCLLLDGAWQRRRFHARLSEGRDAVGRLDVSLLQDFVLAPVLGIQDPRTSPRISFVGGRRGTAELERLVASGEGAAAFAMFATSLDELIAVSDAGGLMPPKSTWFEPKLRDGMASHVFA